MNCPLCKSPNTVLENYADVKLIEDYYLKKGLDVGYLFPDLDKINRIECKNCGLKFFDPPVMGDDKYYSHLQLKENYFYKDKTEYEFSKKFVKSTDSVLDIGSGKGVFKSFIDCAYYQGLDTSSLSVELAQKEGVNVIHEYIQDHSIKKPDFYDVVVIFQVLEHVYEIDSFLQSALKALKKGGKLIIAVPNNDSFLNDAMNNYLNIPPHHVLQWNEQSLMHLADIYKLKNVEVCKEKVRDVHKIWYYFTLRTKIWRKMIKKDYKIAIEKSELTKWNPLQLFVDAYILFLMAINKHKKQDGHTIIAVFEK